MQSIGRLGWAVILVYSVCCALRLARFNVDMEEADRPAWKTKFFIGVPSPSAGGLVMTPIYLQVAGIVDLANYPIVILANTINKVLRIRKTIGARYPSAVALTPSTLAHSLLTV